ncbi:hypothetical protein HK100_007973, partial [Physocladia obscura]
MKENQPRQPREVPRAKLAAPSRTFLGTLIGLLACLGIYISVVTIVLVSDASRYYGRLINRFFQKDRAFKNQIIGAPYDGFFAAYSESRKDIPVSAILADQLNTNPTFSAELDHLVSKQQYFILFEHCNQTDSGSLLIHTSLRTRIREYAKSIASRGGNLADTAGEFLVWREFLESFNSVVSKSRGSTLFTCESFWIDKHDATSTASANNSIDLHNFSRFTVDDRISADTIRLTADYYFGRMPLPDLMKESLSAGLIVEITPQNVGELLFRNGYILVSGDGLSQWNGQRDSMQAAYELGVGLKNGLEWNSVNLSQKHERYVLVSFKIESNPNIRKPVHNLFCNNPSHPMANITNCNFGKVNQTEFYSKVVANSRFVISPHGKGLDCYRTYEALFMNVIPVVVKSSLDSIYSGLPVLILDRWEDLTVQLMEETEISFSKRRWDFRKLYTEY